MHFNAFAKNMYAYSIGVTLRCSDSHRMSDSEHEIIMFERYM